MLFYFISFNFYFDIDNKYILCVLFGVTLTNESNGIHIKWKYRGKFGLHNTQFSFSPFLLLLLVYLYQLKCIFHAWDRNMENHTRIWLSLCGCVCVSMCMNMYKNTNPYRMCKASRSFCTMALLNGIHVDKIMKMYVIVHFYTTHIPLSIFKSVHLQQLNQRRRRQKKKKSKL